MSRFPTQAHFASWMGLCPGTKITGGKVMSGKTKRCAPANQPWARTSGACARVWTNPKAVTAAAHKLARLIYTMLTKGQEYTDQGQDYYEERYRERVLRQLNQRAIKMGMRLVAAEPTA